MVNTCVLTPKPGFSTVISCLPGETSSIESVLCVSVPTSAPSSITVAPDTLERTMSVPGLPLPPTRPPPMRASTGRTARAAPTGRCFFLRQVLDAGAVERAARGVDLLQREDDLAARALDVAVDQLGRAQALARLGQASRRLVGAREDQLDLDQVLAGDQRPALAGGDALLERVGDVAGQVVVLRRRSPRCPAPPCRCRRRRAPTRRDADAGRRPVWPRMPSGDRP